MKGFSSLRQISPNGNFLKKLYTATATELEQCLVKVTGNALNGHAIALIALWFRLIRAYA